MKLYYVSTDRGCTLKAARSASHAEKEARASGAAWVKESRLATDRDVSWVRGMGGYVPTLEG